MPILETAVVATHLLFAGLWTGSVVFVAVAIVPLASGDDMAAKSLDAILGRFVMSSRASALVLFLTGGHMAASGFTFGSLTGAPRGRLVLVMLALWFVLAGLVEVGTGRIRDDLGEGRDSSGTRRSGRVLQAAAVVAGLVLIDAGLLAAG